MRRVNFKFLLVLIIGLAVVAGGIVLLRRLQISRNAGGKREMAEKREKEGKIAEALELWRDYVALRRDDSQALAKYATLLLAKATTPGSTGQDRALAFRMLEEAVERNPKDDDLREKLVKYQLMTGETASAREHLSVLGKRLSAPPETPQDAEAAAARAEKFGRVQLLDAESLIRSGEFAEAAKVLGRLVGFDVAQQRFTAADEPTATTSTTPTLEVEAYVFLARILQDRLDAPAAAEQVLERMVEKRGDQPQAWLAMSMFRRQEGSVHEAAAAVTKAVELAPNEADCVFAQFEVALLAKDLDQAVTVGERAIKLFPDDERSYRGLAVARLQQAQPVEAENVLLQGIDRLPGKSSLMMMLTDVLLQQNKLEEAAQAIRRIREVYGADSGPVGLLEARLLVGKAKWNEAKAKLERVRPLVAGNPELVRQVDLYLGQCHASLGEHDAQLEISRRILTEDPSSLAARVSAAQALFGSGRTDDALAEFEMIAAAIPENQLVAIPQVWYPLLQLRIVSQAELPRSEQDWSGVDRLIDSLAESGTLTAEQLAMLRAEALVRRGEAEAAVELLQEVATDGSDFRVWAALVSLALRMDGPERAREVIGKVPEAVKNEPALLLAEAQVIARSPPAESMPLLDGIEKRAAALEPAPAAQVLAGIAPVRFAAGDREGAMRLWEAAAEKQPEDLGILESILEMAVTTNDTERARTVAARIGEVAGRTSARARVAEATVKMLEARLALESEGLTPDPSRELPEKVRRPLDDARNLLIEAETERSGWGRVQVLFAEIESLKGNAVGAIDRLQRAVEVGPADPAVVRRLVGLLYAVNRLEEAREAMALLGDEGVQGLERISAEAELRAGKFDEAVALAEQSVAGDTKNHGDLLWLGQLLARSGKTERAEQVLERATELAPEEPETWLAVFTNRVAMNQSAEAETALEKAASLLPEPRRQLALAQGYEMLGRPDDAERTLREIFAARPDDVEVTRAMASFHVRKGRRDDAQSLLRKILAAPNDPVAAATKPWARRALAELEAATGDYRQLQVALDLLEENRAAAGGLSPDDLKLTISLLSKRLEPVSWRRALEAIDELAARHVLTMADRLVQVQLREKLGDWNAARSELMAIVASPKTPPAYVALLVEKMIDHGEVSNARTWLRRLEKSTPDSAITAALEAKLAMAENDRQKAVEFAKRLMPEGEITPEQSAQLNAVGRLMEDLGFAKAADRVFEQSAAVSIAGTKGRIEFLSRQGRAADALDLLESIWDELPLEKALSIALQVLRSQIDEPTAVAAAARISPWLEKGTRVDPGSVVTVLLDAELRLLLGRDAEAESLYRGLLSRQEIASVQRAIVENNLAFMLAKPASAAEARRLIDAAIEVLGPVPDLLDTRGLVGLAQGDTEGALADLREAVLEPSPVKFLHLASAELAAGNASAARSSLEKARTRGLAKLRLSSADVARLEELDRELGPASDQTAAGDS